MVVLEIKQRVFSLLDSYDICEPGGGKVFTVRSHLALGRSMSLHDFYDNEVGTIKRRLLTFLPAYDITMNGHPAGTVQKKPSLFCQRFSIDFPGWQVEGDVFGWDYTITQYGRPVARVEKQLMRLSDTYRLTVYDVGDVLPAVLLALTLDAEKDDSSN